jgi:hypothetical protein
MTRLGHYFELGDLVNRKEGWQGWRNQRLGVVVGVEDGVFENDGKLIRVMWSNDYGTFLHPNTTLELAQ